MMLDWWPTRYRMNCIGADLTIALKQLQDTRISDDSRISEDDDDAIQAAMAHVQSASEELKKLANDMKEGVHGLWDCDVG